jgi:hypothetical protein
MIILAAYGRSLNNVLSQSNFSFDSVDDAVVLMRHKYLLWRKLTLKPPIVMYLLTRLTGISWLFAGRRTLIPTYMSISGYLQFGLMNACEVFNRIGRAIVRMMARKGFKCLVVYVDDFLIICPDQATTWYAYWALRALLKRLGFAINPKPHKLIPPCQVIEFLGVTLDSVNMQARLSTQKLAETLSLIHQTLQPPTITHRSLERLNGKLNWICKIVYGGRTFLRRLIDAHWATSRPHHHIRISASLRQDLEWWRDLLPIFNGQTELIPSRPLSFNDFSTDASTSYGYGAFLQGGYFSLSFEQAARIFSYAPAHRLLLYTFTSFS